jgi:glucokinase
MTRENGSAGVGVGTIGSPAGGDRLPAGLGGSGHVASIDLGGTKILAAVFAPDGTIAGRAKKSTGKNRRYAAVVDRMAECVREAAAAAGVPASQLRAVGTGAPGPVELDTGVVKLAPNLDWENVPLRDELQNRLSIPAAVDNDVRVAVLAEHRVGAGRGVANMLGVWPGTGIGGGLVLNGQIYTGADNLAGEIGHMTIEAGGPKCGCGGRGHLEALASRTAIVRDIARAVKKGDKTILTKIAGRDVSGATSGDLAKAVAKGDKLVLKVVSRAAQYLALGIASAVNLLNPELVVLGGGVVEGLGDPFVAQIEAHLRQQPLLTSTGPVRLARSELGDDAGITGAALLARHLAAMRT